MANEYERIRDDSDELLQALDDMKAMEKEKRNEDISTPPFHELADAVEDQAKRVFRMAQGEELDGDRAPTSDVSINEVGPSDSDRSH